jgi:hypothetical protein
MEAKKCRDLRVCDKHDVAAIATIAAVGAGERLELFATNGHASIATVAGAKVQRHLVNKSCHELILPFGVRRALRAEMRCS